MGEEHYLGLKLEKFKFLLLLGVVLDLKFRLLSSLGPLGYHGISRMRKSKRSDLENLGKNLEKLWAKEEKGSKKMDLV